MTNHRDLDSMLKYIHESIKRDCERFIMLNRISSGPLPKIKINDVIWWNRPIFLYAIEKIKEYKMGGYIPFNTDWDFVFTVCQIFELDQGKDVTLWGEALRHFGRNYTEELKISKWSAPWNQIWKMMKRYGRK